MPASMKLQDFHKLSVSEVESYRDQTKELESVLNNDDGLETGLQDISGLRKKINQNKLILSRDEALIAKGREKDKIMNEINRLTELINKDRPTRSMMEAKPGTREFQKAVEMNIYFHKKHTQNMIRLKDLKRRLEPNDPNAGNLEFIRL